jgi:hypothetical protein
VTATGARIGSAFLKRKDNIAPVARRDVVFARFCIAPVLNAPSR